MASDSPTCEPHSFQQRRWSRYHFDVPLIIRAGTVTVNGHGSEMSEGGVGVYAAVDLQVGETVEIEFPLPFSDDASVATTGIVRNRPGDGYFYGMEFVTKSTVERGSLSPVTGNVTGCRRLFGFVDRALG